MPQKDKKLENKEELIFLINSNKLYGAEFKSIKEYIPFEGELKGIKDIEDNIPEKTVDIKLNKISKDKSPEEEQFNIYQTPKKDKKQDILIRTLSKKVVKVPEKISLYDRITLRQSFGKWKELNEYYGNINQKVIDFSSAGVDGYGCQRPALCRGHRHCLYRPPHQSRAV